MRATMSPVDGLSLVHRPSTWPGDESVTGLFVDARSLLRNALIVSGVMTNLFRALSSLLFALSTSSLAHGLAEPRFGGVVQEAADRSFELVATANGAAIYIDDHGELVTPVNWSGRITVVNGVKKVEAPLALVGNKLEAKGVKLKRGTRVVAVITTIQKQVVTIRFVVP